MKQQLKLLPSLRPRFSIDPKNNSITLQEIDLSIPIVSSKSQTILPNKTFLKNNVTSYENFYKGRQGPKDTSILKQIDHKLESHKKDIEARNDMIQYIEKGVDAIKIELVKEKQANEDSQKQITLIQTNNGHLLTQNKQLCNKMKLAQQRIDEFQSQLISTQAELQQIKSNENQKHSSTQLQEQQYQNKENEFMMATEQSKKEIDQLKLDLKLQLQLREQISEQLKKSLESGNQKKLDATKSELIKEKLVNEEIQKQIALIQTNNSHLLTQNKSLSNKMKLAQQRIDEYQNQLNSTQAELQLIKANENQKLSQFQLKEQQYKNKENELILVNEQSKKEIDQLRLDLKDKIKSQQGLSEVSLIQKNKEIELMLAKMQASEQLISTLQDNLTKIITTHETTNKQMQDQFIKQGQKQSTLLNENIQALEKSEKLMVNNLKCTFCNGFVKSPVTVIPCGHSFCLDCKKGYSKECSKCGPKVPNYEYISQVKVEAIYRNELLDDIIGMVKIIQGSINTMKSLGR